MAQMEQYASPVILSDGRVSVDVHRVPVSTIQVISGDGSFKVEGSILGTTFTPIPVVSLKGPEVYRDIEVVPASANGLFAVLSIGFKSLRITGSASLTLDVASLNADPSFVYARLTEESLAPHLIALKASQEEYLAWLMKQWEILKMLLEPEGVA